MVASTNPPAAVGSVTVSGYRGSQDVTAHAAAAATGGAVASSAPNPMVVDHPFAFALIDNASDAPLFLGAIGQL